MLGREHNLAVPLQPEQMANRRVDYLHREANVKKVKKLFSREEIILFSTPVLYWYVSETSVPIYK